MKDIIRKTILSLGADLCGFVHVDRFADAPRGYHPTDVWPECKSVVSLAVALPSGTAKVSPRIIYGHYNDISKAEVDQISFKAAKWMEETLRCTAVPIPCDNPYEYWDAGNLEGKGTLSMKHIAALAGLGALGKSTLLLNERYGSMLTVGAVLTNLDLDSDDLADPVCLEGCTRCIDACPVHAIGEGTVNQKACRGQAYGKTARGFGTVDCNLCRTSCPMVYGKRGNK